MKSQRHSSTPSINTGSMADIAFLLLIFFLVCTTISSDVGLERQLSRPCPPDINCDLIVKENNLLTITINENDELMVRGELTNIHQLKERLVKFIDNNGSDSCNYCNGNKSLLDSDDPTKAKISLNINPKSSYNFYIKVEDEISKAYKELRISYAQQKFGKGLKDLNQEDLVKIKSAYPFNLSDF